VGPKICDGTDELVNGGVYSTSVELPPENVFPWLMNMLPMEVSAMPNARAGITTSGLLSEAGVL
jgi:hypothetical protein